jgi:hypothetical protein
MRAMLNPRVMVCHVRMIPHLYGNGGSVSWPRVAADILLALNLVVSLIGPPHVAFWRGGNGGSRKRLPGHGSITS